MATVSELTFKTGDEIFAQLKSTAEKALIAMTEKMKLWGVKASYADTEGLAANEIISYAEGNRCDLIAMATHGKGEVAWILGSVAEKVVYYATVPVLLTRVMEIKPPVSKEEYAMRIMGPD